LQPTVRPMSGTLDRAAPSGAHYVAGRVIVKFKDGTSSGSRLTAMSASSRTASLSTRPDYANFDVVSIDPNEDAEAVARAFAARPEVEYAQAAYRVHAEMTPNDLYYPLQWNLPLIDVDRAWDIQPSAGSSITVAVLDTGIAYESFTVHAHANAFRVDAGGNVRPPGGSGTLYPALGDLALAYAAATELGPASRFVSPHDFIWNGNMPPLDFDGHGTHVSGTIGQLTNNRTNGLGDVAHGGGTAGVAFNVKLMPVKVLASEWDVIFGGAPDVGGSEIEVALGIRYAADNGAKIINMSLGSSGPAGSAPAIEDAIRYAVGKGVFVAVAGGNDFEMGNPTSVLAEIASRVQGAVSVAAVDRTKAHALYSSTGSWIELAAPGGSGGRDGILQQTLDLNFVRQFDTNFVPFSQFAAPRFDVLAYFYFTGTSQATPHVAGVAAMLMQQGITSPAAIEAALERFAIPCSESQNTCDASIAANHNSTFGYGLVDARNSLRGLGLAR
jgi:serine protease